MQKVMQAYFNTTATTTSPGDVIIMLYDGAISFLERAKQKIIEKDYAQKGILISKAMDVIGELDSSLNIEKGGNLAENLHSLYFFCNTQLLQANLKMDTEKIDKVITILADLREAFATIVHTPEALQAAQTNTMSQRAVAPQTRGTMTNTSSVSPIGNARASSLYAKNSQAFSTRDSAAPCPVAPASPAASMSSQPVQEKAATRQPGVQQPGAQQPRAQQPKEPQSRAQQQAATQSTPQSGTLQSETSQSGITASAPLRPALTDAAEKPAAPAPSATMNASATTPLHGDGQKTQHGEAAITHPAQPSEKVAHETLHADSHTPPPRLESRFQGAALYKKFAQN